MANVNAQDVAAVAAHGQTLFHDPPDTLQWLEPALLAHETGCAVVSDFRRAESDQVAVPSGSGVGSRLTSRRIRSREAWS